MSNIGALLKAEITRLSKREIRKEVTGVKRASATYRREIAALKREVIALQRKSALLEKRTSQVADKTVGALSDRPIRFVAKGLRSLRNRLGMSAEQLALVLGVSAQSVYNWETRKATPRKEQLVAISALRGMGKREAQARLSDIQSARAKPGKKGRGK